MLRKLRNQVIQRWKLFKSSNTAFWIKKIGALAIGIGMIVATLMGAMATTIQPFPASIVIQQGEEYIIPVRIDNTDTVPLDVDITLNPKFTHERLIPLVTGTSGTVPGANSLQAHIITYEIKVDIPEDFERGKYKLVLDRTIGNNVNTFYIDVDIISSPTEGYYLKLVQAWETQSVKIGVVMSILLIIFTFILVSMGRKTK